MGHRKSCYRCSRALTPTVQQVWEPVPPQVVQTERRRAKRFEVYGQGWVVDAIGNQRYPIIVRNISALGLGFDSDESCLIGEHLFLRFEIEGEKFEAETLVRHAARLITEATGFGCGVEFVKASKKLMDFINSMDPGTDSWDRPTDL